MKRKGREGSVKKRIRVTPVANNLLREQAEQGCSSITISNKQSKDPLNGQKPMMISEMKLHTAELLLQRTRGVDYGIRIPRSPILVSSDGTYMDLALQIG